MFLVFNFLHLSLQYFTFSQSFSHFFRQEKGRSQTKQILIGKCSFLIFFKTFKVLHKAIALKIHLRNKHPNHRSIKDQKV